jgi:hypothetical protein
MTRMNHEKLNTLDKGKRNKETNLRSKYKSYCWECHYTIWVNEEIKYNGKARHVDCARALMDNTPREIDSRYLGVYGKVNKNKLRKALTK